MERKIKFAKNELYHLFSRGVEKRKIFLDTNDHERFLALMYILNQKDHFHVSNFLNRGQKNILDLYEQKRSLPLVSILAYSLMPNHIHIVTQEITEGGISNFMQKLLTAYSMYFNKKYTRSGPLFVRPFRSEHIGDSSYFKYIFDYVHLNCLDLYSHRWKELKLKNLKVANKFLCDYRYSSYQDFLFPNKRRESQIINPDKELLSKDPIDIADYLKWYSSEVPINIKDSP